MRFRFIPENGSRIASLEAGEVMMINNVPPDQLMREFFFSKNARRSLYKNPEVDRLLTEATENFDEARVKAAYAKAQELVWDDCSWIWLYEQPDINAITKKLKWKGGRRDEYILFHEASLEA